MTSTDEGQQQGGGLLGALKNNPAISQLGDAAKDYARARGSDAVKKVGDKLTGVTGSLTDKADGGGFTGAAASTAPQNVERGGKPRKDGVAAEGVTGGGV